MHLKCLMKIKQQLLEDNLFARNYVMIYGHSNEDLSVMTYEIPTLFPSSIVVVDQR